MTIQGNEPTDQKEKDVWDKLEIFFKAVASLAVAIVGIFGSLYLQNKQTTDARVQLYTQMMANRELADSELRKEMFNSVINDFMAPKPEGLHELVLALEMLTYNFHDVIDLGPLFKHVALAIAAAPEAERRQLEMRLQKAAAEVVDKQLAALKDAGVVQKQDVLFEDLEKTPAGIIVLDGESSLPFDKQAPAHARKFLVQVLSADPKAKELHVRLEVSAQGKPGEIEEDIDFWVGFSDFPLIDNTRLSNGDRVALVLRRWADERAELAWAYFPGSRASLKDKLYYDELVKQLVQPGNMGMARAWN